MPNSNPSYYDVVVIGAGMAGLTAALNLRRMGRTVLVLERETFGGQITHSPLVENFPCVKAVSGNELISELFSQVETLGAEFELDNAVKIVNDGDNKIVITDGGKFLCRAVIIATGAKPRSLGLARESEFIGEGVSYCSLCDGAFYKGQEIAVIGGGNSALGEALNLSEICGKVYLIHRGAEFRAEKAVVERLKAKANVEILLSSSVTELIGDKTLNAIKISSDKGEYVLNVSAVFVAIGRVPDNDAFSDVVKLDGKGYIIAGEDCVTSCGGIFVAGDCRTKQIRQLTTAASDGAVAAEAANNYIDK